MKIWGCTIQYQVFWRNSRGKLLNTSFTHFLPSSTECVTKWYYHNTSNNSGGRGGGRYENLGVHNFYSRSSEGTLGVHAPPIPPPFGGHGQFKWTGIFALRHNFIVPQGKADLSHPNHFKWMHYLCCSIPNL